MPSFASRAIVAWFQISGRKRAYTDLERLQRDIVASQEKPTAPPPSLSRSFNVESGDEGGFPCYTLRPKESPANLHILYLHGGCYVKEIVRQHWGFLQRLAGPLGATATVPIYPLAPRYQHAEAFAMVLGCYRKILASNLASQVVFMGDSAGAGLALALAALCREEGLPMPRQVVLICPWLDLTMSDPEVIALDALDPMLGIPGMIAAGRMWAGDKDVADPLLSPIHLDLDGLPPMALFSGTHDLLNADAKRFRARLAAEGIAHDYFEYPEMFHDWVLVNIPEGNQAVAEIARLLRRQS